MKKLLALALALCLVFSLGAASASAAVIPQVTLIAAHVNNEESSYHAGLVAFKEKLEELSDGTMTVEIHPNGELGGDETELMEKVASGTCDVIVVHAVFLLCPSPSHADSRIRCVVYLIMTDSDI